MGLFQLLSLNLYPINLGIDLSQTESPRRCQCLSGGVLGAICCLNLFLDLHLFLCDPVLSVLEIFLEDLRTCIFKLGGNSVNNLGEFLSRICIPSNGQKTFIKGLKLINTVCKRIREELGLFRGCRFRFGTFFIFGGFGCRLRGFLLFRHLFFLNLFFRGLWGLTDFFLSHYLILIKARFPYSIKLI